jgi:ribonuclease VapC
VLDASALLAFIQEEPGANLVSEAIDNGAIISTVNLCDVVTKLLDGGFSEAQIQVLLRSVRFETAAFDVDNAWRAVLLRQETRRAVLSLADRACLALAASPALTADRQWATLDLGVEVQAIR